MSSNSPLDTSGQLGTRLRWTNDHDAGDPNEPDVSMINGRPAEPWEREGLLRMKRAAREEAAALVRVARPAGAR